MAKLVRSRIRGASLILELLLGLSLLLIAMLSLFRLFPTAERATLLSDRSTQAHHMASELLDSQLARHYSAITVGVYEELEPITHTKRRGVELQTEFHTRVDITRPYPGKDIFNIAVEVTWFEGNDPGGKSSTVRIESEKGRFW